MSKLTSEMLQAIMPHAPKAKREASLPILNDVAAAYDISNERRMAAWLATLAVESGELKYQEELASGAAYEGRSDLGNTQKGDGRKFKGHGRIQITGRANHQYYTNYLKKSGHLPFIDFIAEPKKLATEPYATDSAGWFFAEKIKANPLADDGNFLKIQIKVNGRNKRTGLPNHWPERNAYWIKGLSVLPNDFKLTKDSAAAPTVDLPVKLSEQLSASSANQAAADAPLVDAPTTLTEVKTTETTDTLTTEVTATAGDVASAPATQVSENRFVSRLLASGGGIGAVFTTIWGFVSGHLDAVAIGIICITALILALIFRGAILDAIRMQTASDPTKFNVK